MEKYSRWRDPGTGIAPFIPPKKLRSDESFLFKGVIGVQTYAVGPIIATVRLLLLTIIGALYSIIDLLGLLLIVPFFTPVSLKKGVRAKQEKQRAGKGSVQSGDLIVSNYSSYIDVLVLEMLYSPTYLYVHPTGQVQPISFLQAIYNASSYPPTSISSKPNKTPLISLKEALQISKANGRPCSLFPEGTTSNNRGLLKFTPVLDSLEDQDGQIHMVGFRYGTSASERVSPSFSVSTWTQESSNPLAGIIAHLFSVSTEFYHGLEVRFLDFGEANETLFNSTVKKVGDLLSGIGPTTENSVTGRAGLLLGQVTRLRMTGMGIEEKRGFWNYYYERETGKKKATGRKEMSDLQAKQK
ncbi:hypothetical protein HDU97_006395 [Phlyctochytrium planicorne]|nr:hypothetical protein HDU97_006395 [Phlyctochytrium planicorne]